MSQFFCSLLVIAILVILCASIILWIVHILSNNDEDCYGHRFWVTFPQFKRVFDMHTDEYSKYIDNSNDIGGWNKPHYLYYGVRKINYNFYYFITPIGYIISSWYIKRYIRHKIVKHGRFTNFRKYKGEL